MSPIETIPASRPCSMTGTWRNFFDVMISMSSLIGAWRVQVTTSRVM
jgi:hypothetical protein